MLTPRSLCRLMQLISVHWAEKFWALALWICLKWTGNEWRKFICHSLAKKVPAAEEKPVEQSSPIAVKKWTREDEAACKIQKYVRRFLAKRQLARRKKERADYEELMHKLEKEVLFLVTILLSLVLIEYFVWCHCSFYQLYVCYN